MERLDKEQEILVAAGELALAEGADAVTVTNVARQLGLARNAITWYFPTRDELLAATFRSLATDAVAMPPGRTDLDRQLERAVRRLADLRPLYLYLGARSRDAPVIAEVIGETQDRLYALLAASLRDHVEPGEIETATGLLGVFIEGLLARPRSDRERTRLLRLARERLVSPGRRGRT